MTEYVKKNDFYFSFASEAEAATALQPFYYQPEEGDAYLVKHSKGHSIDIIGVIYEATGNMFTDDEGMEYPEISPVPGWHVNLRILGDYMRAEAEAIDTDFGVEPATPHRTWL
ncbi:MAG: hypothetical protein L7S63_09675 [Flavobacteriales bacterium]|nr:hypothetical protein [Flavobacteriales bacterium]